MRAHGTERQNQLVAHYSFIELEQYSCCVRQLGWPLARPGSLHQQRGKLQQQGNTHAYEIGHTTTRVANRTKVGFAWGKHVVDMNFQTTLLLPPLPSSKGNKLQAGAGRARSLRCCSACTKIQPFYWLPIQVLVPHTREGMGIHCSCCLCHACPTALGMTMSSDKTTVTR